ncbi:MULTISPECIES: hypothetical protein [unclassified Streptomyces]|uniref:hypothetical protein n=1 Tax=unclassified Streptomyces TaxID=2593676 RepID=UPI000DD6B975|nr:MULTISPECIES: hypothetical protein [unclassified Streptomyces]QZZ26796.1 hypothetical protein A7X85_11510 [Streptomyces sp. ST1015]
MANPVDRRDRRWAELARELEFTQLPELRRQAEGWRAGLTGLTALLAVLVTLKGRDDLAKTPDWSRYTAGALMATAFVLLLAGSVLAVRAAHGSPDHRILLAGRSLRTWTRSEIARVTRYLRYAAACCLAGIALSAAAVIVVWATTEGDPAPSHLIRVTTTTGERCGELLGAGPGGVRIKPGGGKETLLPAAQVTSVTPVTACPS